MQPQFLPTPPLLGGLRFWALLLLPPLLLLLLPPPPPLLLLLLSVYSRLQSLEPPGSSSSRSGSVTLTYRVRVRPIQLISKRVRTN